LLGHPFFQTLWIIKPNQVTVVCSHKKADAIETVKQGDKQIPVNVIRRGKNLEENIELYKSVIEDLNNVSF
jgi:nucleosome binding factor SPN SPT16 subunit